MACQVKSSYTGLINNENLLMTICLFSAAAVLPVSFGWHCGQKTFMAQYHPNIRYRERMRKHRGREREKKTAEHPFHFQMAA